MHAPANEEPRTSVPLEDEVTEVRGGERSRLFAAAIVLAALCGAIYLPVLGHEFLDYDDASYIVNNPDLEHGLTLEFVAKAFSEIYVYNWHPLTMISYALDISLFGENPGPLHAVNLLLHMVNVTLILLLTHRLTGQFLVSAFVAALFAVHPQHVEPVAWLASRKDVLSTALLLVGLHCYLGYVRSERRAWYLATVAAVTAGLLAKQMLVTAPVLLLLLDYWPFGRMSTRRAFLQCIMEKLPLIAICATMAVVVYWVQSSAGSVRADVAAGTRLVNVVMSYRDAAMRTVMPTGLAAFYPPWTGVSVLRITLTAGALAAITGGVVYMRRRVPELMFAWGWLMVCLIPVSGIVPIGAAGTADRYVYLAHIGLFIGIGVLGSRIPSRRGLLAAIGVGSIAVYAMIAAHYVPYFKNDITLFERVTAVTRPHVVPLVNLGNAYRARGWYDEALDRYRAALEVDPGRVDILHNIGVAEARRGAIYAAHEAFSRLVATNAADATARKNRRMMETAIAEAWPVLEELRAQLDRDPADIRTRNELVFRLAALGKPQQALDVCGDPESVVDPAVKAGVYARLNRFDEAIAAYDRAIAEQGRSLDLQFELARVLHRAGRDCDSAKVLERLGKVGFQPALAYAADLGW